MSIKLPKTLIAQFISRTPEVLESGNIAEGQQRKDVERKVAELFMKPGMKTLLTSSNGTGIFAALIYYKTVHKITHVVVQANTMYGIKTMVNLAGLTPVVLAAPNLVMGEEELAEYLDNSQDRKQVVLYSHIGGSVGFNIHNIAKTCAAYSTPLIEDCAHSLGAQNKLYGDVGIFSLYATKALPAGEGGIVFTYDDAVYEFISRFMMYDRIHMEYDVGMNIRVSEIQALLISVALDHMNEIVENRRATAIAYDKACKELGIFTYYQDQKFEDTVNNAYKYIITDPRVIEYFKNRIVTQGEYTGNDILTGTVFGYTLDSEVQAAVPHICLNTNYGINADHIIETIAHLRKAVDVDLISTKL